MQKFRWIAGAVLLATTLGYASSGMAAADTPRDAILQSCATNLPLNEGQCACLADKAEADLDENMFNLFTTMVSDPANVGVSLAEAGASAEDMQSLMAFMQTAPQVCQAQ
ncbi:MAG: hypothetical protein GXP01_05310 [Alphaproteobacteria bacterium]|nr:hypothetical protein [Alphaproteobacteria bacterium]